MYSCKYLKIFIRIRFNLFKEFENISDNSKLIFLNVLLKTKIVMKIVTSFLISRKSSKLSRNPQTFEFYVKF